MIPVMFLLVAGVSVAAHAQASGEWHMTLNNDHSAFLIKLVNNEPTFVFNSATDTLSFAQGNSKAMKAGMVVEVTLKNNNKVFYTSTDKNFKADKTQLIVSMADVFGSLKGIKLPSKPKYVLSVKDKTVVKQKLEFEFAEK